MAILTPTRNTGQGVLNIAHLYYFDATGAAQAANITAADIDFNTVFAAYSVLQLRGITAEISSGLAKFTVNRAGLYRLKVQLRGLYETASQLVSNTVTKNGSAFSPIVRTDGQAPGDAGWLDLNIDTVIGLRRGDYVRPRLFSSSNSANGYTIKNLEFMLYGI